MIKTVTIFLIGCLLFEVNLTIVAQGIREEGLSSESRTSKLVQAHEHISNYENHFPCLSFDSIRNQAEYPAECLTNNCGRRVIDGVFEPEDIQKLLAIAEKGMSYRNDSGGPTILDINTGYIRDSLGLDNLFVNHAKGNKESVFTAEEFAHYGKIIHKLKEIVQETFHISNLYFTAPTFITRINAEHSKKWKPAGVHDEYWHPHVDMNNTAHYQYSGLLYLSTYNQNFTGGRFHFVNSQQHEHFDSAFQQDLTNSFKDHSNLVELTMEPKAGRIVIFSSGKENTHFVEQVKTGKRFVLSFWFTCDERKQFSIFLDGNAHITFSKYFRDKMTLSEEKLNRKYARRTPMYQQKLDEEASNEL